MVVHPLEVPAQRKHTGNGEVSGNDIGGRLANLNTRQELQYYSLPLAMLSFFTRTISNFLQPTGGIVR